jgi:sugar phosphate isomerase/epimerase
MTLLSIQDRLVPGSSIRQKFDNARRYGFDAIELNEPPVPAHAEEAIRDGVTVSAMCAGYRGWLIDPDPAGIELARSDIKRLLELAAQLGTGEIVVPIYGRTRNLPNNGTGRTREEDERIFLEGMRELAANAEQVGALLYLEAINRYENDLCVTVADSLRYRELIGSSSVRTMGDVFHMNIEEAELGASLERAGDVLGYVHLADSQRLEPGRGHLDFRPVFAALDRIGYRGYASLECRLSGDPESVLPRSVEFLRRQMQVAVA